MGVLKTRQMCRFNGATSFQTWKLCSVSGSLFPDKGASMGPRLFRRGNGDVSVKKGRGEALQWGHVFSDVEIPCGDDNRPRTTWLQWGHVFSDVEISIQASVSSSSSVLQWGHVFSDVEISDLGDRLEVNHGASMGPRLFRRGNKKRRNREKI